MTRDLDARLDADLKIIIGCDESWDKQFTRKFQASLASGELIVRTCPCGFSVYVKPDECWRCSACNRLCECGKHHPAWCPMHGSIAARMEANGR